MGARIKNLLFLNVSRELGSEVEQLVLELVHRRDAGGAGKGLTCCATMVGPHTELNFILKHKIFKCITAPCL